MAKAVTYLKYLKNVHRRYADKHFFVLGIHKFFSFLYAHNLTAHNLIAYLSCINSCLSGALSKDTQKHLSRDFTKCTFGRALSTDSAYTFAPSAQNLHWAHSRAAKDTISSCRLRRLFRLCRLILISLVAHQKVCLCWGFTAQSTHMGHV